MTTRRISVLLGILCGVLTAAIVYDLLRPLEPLAGNGALAPSVAVADRGGASSRPGRGPAEPNIILATIRSRKLFHPASPLPSKGTAHKSIDRIKGLLTLYTVMDVKGVPTAYIKVEGKGLTKVHAGDEIEGLFSVREISAGSVVLDIFGQNVTLER